MSSDFLYPEFVRYIDAQVSQQCPMRVIDTRMVNYSTLSIMFRAGNVGYEIKVNEKLIPPVMTDDQMIRLTLQKHGAAAIYQAMQTGPYIDEAIKAENEDRLREMRAFAQPIIVQILREWARFQGT